MTPLEQILAIDQTLRLLSHWREEIEPSQDPAETAHADAKAPAKPPGIEDLSDALAQDQLTATLDWQFRLFDERRQELLWALSEEELAQYEKLAQST